jgi:hypothetical protein
MSRGSLCFHETFLHARRDGSRLACLLQTRSSLRLPSRGVTGGDTGDDAILFCSFGEVDLTGGSYKNWLFSEGGDEGGDECRLFMGPLDPSKMTPAVPYSIAKSAG